MNTEQQSPATTLVSEAASRAGLVVLGAETRTNAHGQATVRVSLGLPSAPEAKRTHVDLSEDAVEHTAGMAEVLEAHLREAAKRLVNPNPELYVSAAGLPLRFHGFEWPFHGSTSGADTKILHGLVHLEDGTGTPLHSRIAASMTVTFAEVVPSIEQPFAESFLYNAVRKTFDYGQLELLKSGNRQPVPVTMRYWSRWANKFVFTETDDAARKDFVALKLFWLSAVLGGNFPVWLADPRDAMYLNTTPEELLRAVRELEAEGLAAGVPTLGAEYAAATPALAAQQPLYLAKLAAALDAIKPSFNESMRAGHTNM
jgi:hypothetical protein